jgi:hypothetical protein
MLTWESEISPFLVREVLGQGTRASACLCLSLSPTTSPAVQLELYLLLWKTEEKNKRPPSQAPGRETKR